jgi:hypothetical protein
MIPGHQTRRHCDDGDGYWDGWLGVYGVGYSDNVILYREHLRDTDDTTTNKNGKTIYGIRGDERVDAQVGVHSINTNASTAAAMGADIDGDGTKEHSNIHLGELHWGTNPDDDSSTPSPSLTVEVDYYASLGQSTLNTSSWEQGIEQNYALYGFDVDIIRDETIDEEDFPDQGKFRVIPDDGFTYHEILITDSIHKSTHANEYVLVTNRGQNFISESQTGVNLFGVNTQAIFYQGNMLTKNNSKVPVGAIQRSPYKSGIAFVSAKTQIHEIAHAFEIGELDDTGLENPYRKLTKNGEIYSGSDGDNTPERLYGKLEWSIMAGGWRYDMITSPMNAYYLAFSIEELLSS